MPVYGLFASSTLGMKSQSLAMSVTGRNIANVNTTGYKRAETHFHTVMSDALFRQSDLGGVRADALQRNREQGPVQASNNALDLAIAGQGFFVTNTQLDGNGETIYTRDGSFRERTANPFTVTDPDSGLSFQTSESYLIDKNGNYLLGYAANPDGSFPTTGTPAPMRVDPRAFVDSGRSTTDASIRMNLPANAAVVSNHLTAVSDLNTNNVKADGMETFVINFIDSNGDSRSARLNFTKSESNTWEVSATYQGAPVAQVDTITIGGTIEAGDVYSIQVDDNTVSYTATATDTLDDVVAGLVDVVNNTNLTNSIVSAAAGAPGSGQLTLTAQDSGTAFDAQVGATNAPSVAQVDTLTITGAVEAGDVYQVTVDGNTVSYTVTGAEANLAAIVNNIVSTINSTAPVNGTVDASAGSNPGEILLEADTAGTPFTATASVTDGGSTAQVDTVTIGGTMEVGDVYSVTVDGTTVSYTVDGTEGGLAGVRSALVSAINANSTISGIVTAADGGAAGELTLTADAPGTPFTATTSATDGGGTNDNTAAVATTTANVTGPNPNSASITTTTTSVSPVNDNTASVSTTTANDEGLVTTGVTQLDFLGDGRAGTPSPTVPGGLVAPDPISLSFTFPAEGSTPASTAAFDLDVADITQYATDFLFNGYDQNGFAKAQMTDIGFDTAGQVIGFFSNGSSKPIYKIPLATFANPDGLETRNGMTFAASEESGPPTVAVADLAGNAFFVPSALESSNVELVDEFTNMIRTQQAYNSSANVFRTVDEMTEVARDLKR